MDLGLCGWGARDFGWQRFLRQQCEDSHGFRWSVLSSCALSHASKSSTDSI